MASAAQSGADIALRKATRNLCAHQYDGGHQSPDLSVRPCCIPAKRAALRPAIPLSAEAVLAAAEQAERDKANALELEAARDPFAVVDPANLNFDWAGAGDTELLPSRTYDNGEVVFLTWGQDAEIPAILGVNSEGEEGPLNFAVRGNTIVLSDLPAQIVLRKGKARATLTNVGPPRPRNADAGSGPARGS
jgi:type IV secretion system protein VirB9